MVLLTPAQIMVSVVLLVVVVVVVGLAPLRGLLLVAPGVPIMAAVPIAFLIAEGDAAGIDADHDIGRLGRRRRCGDRHRAADDREAKSQSLDFTVHVRFSFFRGMVAT